MSEIKYRPEIDGLRAIAVIPVILFHFNKDWLPGGFVGVDVFFVISGFLITSIILDEYERGVFSFYNFWLRRIRRILPALLTMVLVTLVTGIIFTYAGDINNLGAHGLASLLSFANISHYLIAGNYWGHAAENSPFLHTWSLSVEEQFYLFFPLLLFVVLKYFHKWMPLIIFFFSLLSILLFLLGAQKHPSATFYLLPTRAWELGFGALLAVILSKRRIHFNNNTVLSALGVLSVLISYFIVSGKDGISPLIVVPVIGATFIIAFARNSDSIVNRSLSNLPAVYIGKISYSLYLWHWPILVFSKQLALNQNGEVNPMIIILIIFIVSSLSYHYIEVPTRRNGRAAPYILVVLITGVIFSYCLKTENYMEDTSSYNKTEWNGSLYNVNPNQEWPDSVKKRMSGITVAHTESIEKNAYRSGGIQKLYGGKKPEIIVFGDSHSLMWARLLDDTARELSTSISFYSADGTPTFFSIPPKKMDHGTLFFSAKEKYEFDNARMKYLAELNPKVVVIASKWSGVDKEETSDLIHYIGGLGVKVLLIEQPPELYFGNKNAPQYLAYLGKTSTKQSNQYVRHVESERYKNGISIVKQIAEENDFCTMVPILDIFLNDNRAWVISSKDVLYIDDDHLSQDGALKAKDRIFSALKKSIQ